MTTAEIVHVYENSRLQSNNFTPDAVTAAYISGLSALHEKAEREVNNPLTMDQLQEMEGDPVWVVQISESIFFRDAWMLVTEYGAIDRKQSMTFCEYGKTWLAYRHKPEEGTK